MEHDYRWSDVHHAEEAFMYEKTICLLSDYIRTHRGDFYRLCKKIGNVYLFETLDPK